MKPRQLASSADQKAIVLSPSKRPIRADSKGMPSLPTQLAHQILERVKFANISAGDHLSEQHLADALRVSRTPTRQALQQLEQMELVERRPNRGFFLTKTAKDLRINPLLGSGEIENPSILRSQKIVFPEASPRASQRSSSCGGMGLHAPES